MVNQVGKQYNVPYQALTPYQVNNPNGKPPMEGVDSEKIKQGVQNVKNDVENSYVSNRLNELMGEDTDKKLLLSVPIWYGLAQGMDKFAKKCQGEYGSTVQAKIGNFGDKVANGFENSTVGKSSVTKFAKGFFNTIGKFYNEKLLPHSAILRALKHTPSVPENTMVLGQAGGMKGFLLFDYPQIADNFLKPLKSAKDLDCYGASKEQIEKIFKEISSTTGNEAKASILQRAEFDLLKDGKMSVSEFIGKSDLDKAEILKNLKAKAMGYMDVADFEAVKKGIHEPKNIEKVIEACKKSGDKYTSRIWGSRGNLGGRIKGHIMGRDVKFSEMSNKLMGSLGTEKIGKFASQHKTWLGKMLPKMSNVFLEASTNRVAGGKFIAAMQAWWLAEVLIKSARAEKGDKTKTFVERTAELLGFFVFMPIAIQLMHRAGGLQYSGMSKEQVSAYRKAVEAFNKKADEAGFASKEAYKTSKKALRNMLKADTKNPITNLFKRAGRVITVGLEQLRPYSKTVAPKGEFKSLSRLKDVFRHPKYWMKQCAGWPMRLILAMMVVMPFLNNLGVKFVHKIFGRPKKSVLDKEEEVKPKATEKETAMYQQLLDEAKQKQQTVQSVPQGNLLNPYRQSPFVSNNSSTNLLRNPKPVETNRIVNNTINNTIVNNKKDDDKTPEPVRTYVPSPIGVQVKEQDTTQANSALQRAARAEEEALKILKMK